MTNRKSIDHLNTAEQLITALLLNFRKNEVPGAFLIPPALNTTTSQHVPEFAQGTHDLLCASFGSGWTTLFDQITWHEPDSDEDDERDWCRFSGMIRAFDTQIDVQLTWVECPNDDFVTIVTLIINSIAYEVSLKPKLCHQVSNVLSLAFALWDTNALMLVHRAVEYVVPYYAWSLHKKLKPVDNRVLSAFVALTKGDWQPWIDALNQSLRGLVLVTDQIELVDASIPSWRAGQITFSLSYGVNVFGTPTITAQRYDDVMNEKSFSWDALQSSMAHHAEWFLVALHELNLL